MFEKVLIANRGEIACRVAAALKAKGIASVAIYSDADAEAPHRAAADESVYVGASPVAQSYLNQDAVFAAAHATGAQAIHPGYGLLSENAAFARRCVAEGLVFIGPSAEVIEAMGDKARARDAAQRAGVPVVPGSAGEVTDEAAGALADEMGYPVLVKAAGGGGGIGMQVVKKPARLQRALTSCRDRGASSFGNDAVYLEKYIMNPRHIEVQVLFDHHGHGVHLFERECTLQRRHQKVVEEAPSPFLATRPELRAELCAAAVKAAAAVGYRNAGTVEFIVSPDGQFYFIEMNTRLQVEHPVTEMTTGVDLVSWQVEIAAGAPLTLQQDDLKATGSAIECRIYAEDPYKKFVPRPGHLDRLVVPTGEGVRFDSGVQSGQEITPFYDPLLAKLIAWGPDRVQATARLQGALEQLRLEGLTTNRTFLQAVLATDKFAAGDFDTMWLASFAKTL